MNNEPVAWVEENNINMIGHQFDFQFVAFSRKPKSEADWIPLYTHPAKTLTDDEYDNIFANGKRLGVLETEDKFRKVKTLTDEEIKTIDKLVDLCWGFSVSGVYFHEFQENVETIEKVDAILKKASEK
jgi:hypothetical protein